MPLGKSTAMTGAACSFMASIMARGSPSTGRSSPAPNKASITASAPASPAGRRPIVGPFHLFAASRRVAFQTRRVTDEQDAHRIAALRE